MRFFSSTGQQLHRNLRRGFPLLIPNIFFYCEIYYFCIEGGSVLSFSLPCTFTSIVLHFLRLLPLFLLPLFLPVLLSLPHPPGCSVRPPELAIRLCAVVCRSRGDQPILSKVTGLPPIILGLVTPPIYKPLS